jgi:hypothetical protein
MLTNCGMCMKVFIYFSPFPFPPSLLLHSQTSALDSSNVELTYQNILTEIYHIMSRPPPIADGEDGDNHQPGKGETLDLSPEVAKTDGGCKC